MIDKSEFKRAEIRCSLSPGEALKKIRTLQEVSQNELEALTGISQSNISALENGSVQIGRERALILAKALKVHPAVILFPDYDINQVA